LKTWKPQFGPVNCGFQVDPVACPLAKALS